MDGQKPEEAPTQPFGSGVDFPIEQAPAAAQGAAYAASDGFSWTASEFIAHHKTSGWYAILLSAAAGAATLIWLITEDIVSSFVVIFVAIMFAAYAGRQPRQLTYQLDASGLMVAQRHYGYDQFRSFSVVPEGAFSSIVFSPLKRFGTLLTIYYDPNDEDKIITVISQHLPHEQYRPDVVDSIMSRIRF